MSRSIEVIVVGGGQAGLAMSRLLTLDGIPHLVLDASPRLGTSWRRRWDSLTCFTPAAYSGLPGLAFPGDPRRYPTKDEVADYLETYAAHFGLPVRLDTPVHGVRSDPDGDGFVLATRNGEIRSRAVVVATGAFQVPVRPAWSAALDRGVMQLHGGEYRNPAQLPDGPVLVVGGGNSGVQIAAELAATRSVALSLGHPLARLPQQLLGRSIFWWLDRAGAMNVSVRSRLGRRASRRELLIGTTPEMIARSHGVALRTRAVAAEGSGVRLADDTRVEPAAVVFATGYRRDFGWIDVPVLDPASQPVHDRGITAAPGFYFLGLPWQYTRGSALIGWVGRDAEYLMGDLRARLRRPGRTSMPTPLPPAATAARIA